MNVEIIIATPTCHDPRKNHHHTQPAEVVITVTGERSRRAWFFSDVMHKINMHDRFCHD